MKKILEVINNNVSRGKKSLIFTQSNELVRTFLYDNPGKWKVNVNTKFWHKSVMYSDKRDKIEFVDEAAQVGLDRFGLDVVFTKRPCLMPDAKWCVIQTYFDSPVVMFEQNVERFMEHAILFVDDKGKYENMLNLVGGGREVYDDITYAEGERAVIAKRFCDPFDLCQLHAVRTIVVPEAILWEQMPTIFQCQSIMEAMSMVDSTIGKGSAVDAEWIGRHAIVNSFAIPRTLQLLEAMGCVRPVVVDDSMVVIQKKPPCQASIEFGKIPEGQFKLVEIKKLLGNDALTILKSYENNGLIFGFSEKKHTYYVPLAPADRERYHDAVDVLSLQTQRWKQLAGSGKWLNNALHENVRKMYNSHEVYMTNESMTEIEKVNDVMAVTI